MDATHDTKQFAQKMLGIYTGGILTQMMDIGHRTGLFDASVAGAFTTEELSERAGVEERYVREWLGAMTTGGIYTYDPATDRYALPEAHAAVLTGNKASNLSPMGTLVNRLSEQVPALVDCFHNGGGIPYEAYRPGFTHDLDDLWRRVYDEHLVDGFLGDFDDMRQALQEGIRVLDVGCGTGHAINLLAWEYPNSTFFGYDIAEDAIGLARAETAEWGLTNTTFEVMDAAQLPTQPQFDLAIAVDAIHDQAAPQTVLGRIHDALKPGGYFLMVEFNFRSNVGGNIGNPFAPLYYGLSLLHCTPVSMAAGGPGLGAVWGEETARKMLVEAGFGDVTVTDTPRPQNYMFVCRR